MHKKKKTKQYILIVVSIVFAFVIMRSMTPRLFVANTPTLNPDFVATLQKSPIAVFAYLGNIQEDATLKDHLETAKIPRAIPPEGTNYAPFAKGVQASEGGENERRFVKIEKGTKLEIHTITLSGGNTVKVYVPVE